MTAARVSALALALAACGGAPASVGREQGSAARAEGESETPFVFDWGAPCRVPVYEVFRRLEGVVGLSRESRYVIDVRADGGELRVDHQEELWLTVNEQYVATPEAHVDLGVVQAALSYTPGYRVGADGAFLRTEAFDVTRLDGMDPELAEAVRLQVLGEIMQSIRPVQQGWEWRALVGGWRGWTVPDGEVRLVAGGGAQGRARLEHLGSADDGVRLRRTEWIDGGDWISVLLPVVLGRLDAARTHGAPAQADLDRAEATTRLHAVYEVVTDPHTLRPSSAGSVITQSVEVRGEPIEIREDRGYELDWSQAEGCGAAPAP